MGKCAYPDCEEAGLLFTCKLCGEKYCGKHRLPEMHDCPYLDYYKSAEYRQMKMRRIEQPIQTSHTQTMNQNRETVVLTRQSFNQSLLPTRPINFMSLFSFGSVRKDLLVGVILAMVTMQFFYVSWTQIMEFDIIGLSYSIILTGALGGIIVYSRYYFAREAYRKAGGDILVGHTLLNILATLLTNMIPMFFRWISFGLFLPFPEPQDMKKGARGILGVYSFTTGLAFFFLTLSIAFNVFIVSANGIITHLIVITNYVLVNAGAAILIFNIIMSIPLGYTDGGILLKYNKNMFILLLVGTIIAFIIYIIPALAELGIPILLALIGMSWGIFEVLLSSHN